MKEAASSAVPGSSGVIPPAIVEQLEQLVDFQRRVVLLEGATPKSRGTLGPNLFYAYTCYARLAHPSG